MWSILESPPPRTRVRPPERSRRRATFTSAVDPAGPTSQPPQEVDEYVAFGNVEARNGLQERLEIPTLIRALRLPVGGDMLEIGCGRGVALPVLARRLRPRSLVGLDIDPELVALAEQRVHAERIEATLIEGDARDMPIETESVDLVIDFGTCYHVSGGWEGSSAALSEIARVLRPGGLFVHETPVAQHLAHPVRSFGRTLPWVDVPSLVFERSAVLWAVRRKVLTDRSS